MSRVLFVPFGSLNPYHKLLVDGVENEDYEAVIGDVMVLFPLLRQVLAEDIDIIHMTWTQYFFITTRFESNILNKSVSILRGLQLLTELLILRLLGKDILWVFHDKYNHEKDHKKIDLSINWFVSRIVNGIKVECSKAKKVVKEIYNISGEKVSIVPEGNYSSAYPNDVSREESREVIGLEDDDFAFVFFGLIRPYKDVPRLIDEFKSLNNENAKLIIAGRPNSEELEKRIRNRANKENIDLYLEYIDEEDVQYYLKGADVMVFSYKDILTSGSVLLGMTFGKPIITANLGCIPEIIGHNKLLYDPDVKGSIEKSMETSMESDLEKIGRKNREKAESLDWETIGEEIRSIYSSL